MQELWSVSLQGTTVRPELLLLFVLIAAALTGCIDSPGDGVKVITMGATDGENHIADFSGSGPTRDGRVQPTLVAPGVAVVSTVPPGLSDIKYIGVYYAKGSGTSISTPVAAGVAALLLQKNRSLSPAGVKAAMTLGARKLNNTLGEEYEPYYQGAGLIDAYGAASSLNNDLCGVIPDMWQIGRWAFPEGGSSISPGLDAGADRLQKKIYAMAPGDEDWTTRFLFFTNRSLQNVSVKSTGPIADWLTVMPLPKNMPENGQSLFGASATVPNGTEPGLYEGAIEISEKNRVIFSLPVQVEVASSLAIIMGSGSVADLIGRSQWKYYYFDVPLGAESIQCSLAWKKENPDGDLDLFVLSPTSEYHTSVAAEDLEASEAKKTMILDDPPSGRWLVAIHSRNLTSPERYTFEADLSHLKSEPGRWAVGAVQPGESSAASFRVANMGLAMDNLTYESVIENANTTRLSGSIDSEENWYEYVEVPDKCSRLTIKLSWSDESNDLDLYAYNPDGELESESSGTSNTEEVDVYDPVPGRWRISVKGYDIPHGVSQDFNLTATSYSKDIWSWVKASGPKTIDAGAVGAVDVSFSVPSRAVGREVSGYIEIKPEGERNATLQIPVDMIISGATIQSVDMKSMPDIDKDGYLDELNLEVGVDASMAGTYRAEGGLSDCNGEMIKWLSGSAEVDGTGTIPLTAMGRDIWKSGGCGPLSVNEIFLYNDHGDLIGRFNASTVIDTEPDQFQPPAAYFNGSFVNMSTVLGGKISRIAVGVGVSVFVTGSYRISATLEDDDGSEIDSCDRNVELDTGNHTVIIEFNPRKFVMWREESKLHMLDLKLTLDGDVVDSIDEPWTSGVLTDEDFTSERGYVRVT